MAGEDKIREMVEAMTDMEQMFALKSIRTEYLWNELENRVKDLILYRERIEKAVQNDNSGANKHF